jgi:hypothetical protein
MCEGQLRFGRIDPLHLGGAATLDQQLGEGAIAAPDIEPTLAWGGCQPRKKNVTGALAPTRPSPVRRLHRH